MSRWGRPSALRPAHHRRTPAGARPRAKDRQADLAAGRWAVDSGRKAPLMATTPTHFSICVQVRVESHSAPSCGHQLDLYQRVCRAGGAKRLQPHPCTHTHHRWAKRVVLGTLNNEVEKTVLVRLRGTFSVMGDRMRGSTLKTAWHPRCPLVRLSGRAT